jgi:outer membrane receptor protein involved in Fe transport
MAGARFVYQLGGYDMTIRDDIVTYTTPSNSREVRNAGRTRHRGVEASAGLAVTAALRVDAAWSVTSQRYVDWTPQAARPAANGKPAVAEVSYAGHAMEMAPRDLGSVLVAFAPTSLNGARAEAEWSHIGRYATDPANTHSYGGYDQVNVRLSTPISSRAELFARVINLTNRKYAELVSYDSFLKEQYTPGAPRSVVLGMRLGR